MANEDYREIADEAREHGLTQRHRFRLEMAVRREVADELRWLAGARKDYCRTCPQTATDYHGMSPMDLAVHEEHASASWLAEIVERKNDAKGWLPSWRWDEWEARNG